MKEVEVLDLKAITHLPFACNSKHVRLADRDGARETVNNGCQYRVNQGPWRCRGNKRRYDYVNAYKVLRLGENLF